MERMKIMLVDDEERFLETTKKLLSRKHVDVITAVDGAQALNELEKNPVHVVILDVKMPGMDGIAVLKEMKKRFPLIAVIMLTGHATLEIAIEGLKSGATDFLIKPADIDEIFQKADDAFLNQQRLNQKIQVAQTSGGTPA